MKLIDPTDDVLDEVFATEISKWKRTKAKIGGSDPLWDTGTDALNQGSGWAFRVPRYTKLVDLILPWLERSPFDVTISYSNTCSMWYVNLLGRFTSSKNVTANDESLPRAMVIALLRANGVEVDFK